MTLLTVAANTRWIMAASVFAVCVSVTAPAQATVLTYDFTATANGGALNGNVFKGVLTVDQASVVALQGAATIISLNVLGVIVTGSEGLFGQTPQATFMADGTLNSLANFVVAGPARAASQGFSPVTPLPSPITSILFDGRFNYGTDPNKGEIFTGGAVSGTVEAMAVPEPATLVIASMGLTALGLMRRRGR